MKQLLKKISSDDWQYLLPILICATCFLASDILQVIDKVNFAYWSGRLPREPYRILSTHFIHGDIQHLLANVFGIIIARYCLKELKLKSNYFFIFLISLLIPIQTVIFWTIDIFYLKNPTSVAIGLSGIIYGIHSFLLLASISGKQKFLWIKLELIKEQKIRNLLLTITIIGILLSFSPGISLTGHLAGFIAGIFLYLF